jgi:hypothetical protein
VLDLTGEKRYGNPEISDPRRPKPLFVSAVIFYPTCFFRLGRVTSCFHSIDFDLNNFSIQLKFLEEIYHKLKMLAS